MEIQLWQFNAVISIATLLCISVMSIHAERNPTMNSRTKSWFHHITFAVSICTIAACVGGYLDEHPMPPIYNTVATLVEFCIAPFIAVFLCGAYGMRKSLWTAVAIMLSNVILQVSAAPFGLVFRILPDGSYVRGDLYLVYIAVIAVSIAFALYSAIRFSRRFKDSDTATLAIIVALVAVGCIAQGLNPNLKTTYICVSLAMLLFYLHNDGLVQQSMFDQINEQIAYFGRTQQRMMSGLAEIIEVRDENTGQHVVRTANYVRILALKARNSNYHSDILTDDYISMMVQCAYLHDVGKVAVPDAILNKPGKLTNEEFEVIKTHTTQGGRIIESIMGDVVDPDYLACTKEIAIFHHERWDGAGYPIGLIGEEIPLCARIMAIADVYDALTAKRVYKNAMSPEKAIAIIASDAGSHFDPVLANLFVNSKNEIILAGTASSFNTFPTYGYGLKIA